MALGSAAAVPWTRGVREVGVLVEDAWQHRGIGDTLVRALYLDALRMGDHTITVEACTSANPWMPDHLRRLAHVTSVSRSGCDVSIETDIAETVRLYACSHWAA